MNVKFSSTLGNYEKILKLRNYSENTINNYVHYVDRFLTEMDKSGLHITGKEIMEKIKIGDVFKNWKNNIHVVNKISKTGLVIHAKNIETGVVEKFRFYEASGKYIIQTTPNTDLGDLTNIGETLEVNNQCKVVLKKEYR